MPAKIRRLLHEDTGELKAITPKIPTTHHNARESGQCAVTVKPKLTASFSKVTLFRLSLSGFILKFNMTMISEL